MEVNRLQSDELSYELSVHGYTTGRTVDEKRHLPSRTVAQGEAG